MHKHEDPPKLIPERRHYPTIAFTVGQRHYALDSLKGILMVGAFVTLMFTFAQFSFKMLDLRVGRGADAKIAMLERMAEAEMRTRAHEDSISREERRFLLQQNMFTHQQLQDVILVVCAAVSEQSSTLTRIKCDEALRNSGAKNERP